MILMNLLKEYLLKLVNLLVLYTNSEFFYQDYCGIIYDKAFIGPFQKKLESIQYSATLALKGAIRGTSREKFYSELGLESLQGGRWCRKLCFL